MKRDDKLDPEAQELFREAMQGVRRKQHDHVHPHSHRPGPVSPIRRLEEWEEKPQLPLGGAGYSDSDPEQQFTRNGVQRAVLRRLRRGGVPHEAKIDLHGCRLPEAEQLLQRSLREGQKQGLRCLLVIHGKGLRSPDRRSILKHETLHWLRRHPSVLAYCPAQPRHGGSGALYVLLTSKTTA